MPTGAFNVGRDITLDIVDPVQGALRFSLKTAFQSQPQFKQLESNALDGVPRFAALPAGHKLTFGFDRADPRIDNYFVGREAAYFAGQVLPNATITETITEVSGAVSKYRYTDVSLTLSDSGNYKGDSIVSQTIEGMASKKVAA